ncbi:MAG: winged helix-turn-helix transcriptional regulator [Desulfobacterales bacterium]
MDPKDIRTLKILEKVDNEIVPSQRDLARELNISLGLVNSFLKRLVKKGYFKARHIPKNRMRYYLTPQGASEKTRLTYEYIQYSYNFYKEARQKLRDLYSGLEKQGVSRIVFYGAGDLAEIAYLSLQETNIELVAVFDDEKIGKRFMKYTVVHPDRLTWLSFDKILITSMISAELILQKVFALGISKGSVVQIS